MPRLMRSCIQSSAARWVRNAGQLSSVPRRHAHRILPSSSIWSRRNPNLGITELGNGRYRVNIDVTHFGWSGLLLLTGNGPFDRDIIAPPVGERTPAWRDRFVAASNGNWQGDMVWFQTVDQQQD